MHWVIGVDFDNTLVSYDRVFWKIAKRLKFIDKDIFCDKKNIRDAIRSLPGGERKWQEVQAYVYGKAMDEAILIDGVQKFFQMCQRLGARAYIISHKTKFAAQDTEKINLRQVALDWMAQKGFFDSKGLGFSADQVFFESTRQKKIQRIKKLGCTHFIDDLEEIFYEKSFPQGVKKILYCPQSKNSFASEVKAFKTWASIQRCFVDEKFKDLEKNL